MNYVFVDYVVAKECKNKKTSGICLKCRKCGRKFNDEGLMVDDGGTHPQEEE